jgi:hypothetical protein
MSEAGELLRRILETGDIVGQDSAGRTIVQLAVDRHMLGLLTAFGADAAERDDGGDDEPYEVPPVSLCWLDAASARRKSRGRTDPDPSRSTARSPRASGAFAT